MQPICFGIGSLSLFRTGWMVAPVILLIMYVCWHERQTLREKKKLMSHMDANNQNLVDAVDKNTKAVIEVRTMLTTLS